MYYFIAIISFVITLVAQIFVSYNYSKYRKVKSKHGLSGVEVASNLLKEYDLDDIYVIETKGELTDHYDPEAKVIRLSTSVFHGTDVAACAVAAHEVGHAIQYKEGNKFIRIRSAIFPFIRFCSNIGYIVIVISLILGAIDMFYLGIVLLSMILLFQLLTLPVEFDASRKGLNNLSKFSVLEKSELDSAKQVLFAAALTYVASLVSNILEILRLLLIARDRDD